MQSNNDSDLAPFDAADYLATPEDVVEYLKAVLAENDADYLLRALATIARSPAMRLIEHLDDVDNRRSPDGRSADVNLAIIGRIATTIAAHTTAAA